MDLVNKMLIVDDDETNREVLEVIFDQDFILQQVESGEAALEILPKFMPDIILLDIMMGGIDGYEVCRRIRSNPDYNSIIVVFVSARAEENDKQKGVEVGANEYITKPFRPAKIYQIINELMQAHL